MEAQGLSVLGPIMLTGQFHRAVGALMLLSGGLLISALDRGRGQLSGESPYYDYFKSDIHSISSSHYAHWHRAELLRTLRWEYSFLRATFRQPLQPRMLYDCMYRHKG